MKVNFLTYYNKSLLALFEKIKLLQKKPFSSASLCFDIQANLVKRIKYIERQIRYWKKKFKESHDERDKEYFWAIVEEYRFILYLFKSIGDCIAYIFIDRWDIKPLNFRSSSGFISDKVGFAEEYRILRQASSMGINCLLADITNVLRHGDVYVFKGDRLPLIMEVKKNKKKLNPRCIKQRNRLEQLIEYLQTDQTKSFLGKDIHAYRFEPSIRDKYYLNVLNRTINKAYVKGSHVEMVEDGLYYAASTTDEPNFISNTVKHCKTPMVFLLNQAKVNHGHYPYYPLALSVKEPNAVLDFYHGQIIILVIVDLDVVINSFKSDNIDCRLLESDEYLFQLTYPDGKAKALTGPMQVSKAFFAKIGYEFLSLKWLLSLSVERMHSANTMKRSL